MKAVYMIMIKLNGDELVTVQNDNKNNAIELAALWRRVIIDSGLSGSITAFDVKSLQVIYEFEY